MSEPLDRLAKLLAGGGTRRDALKYLGGLLAGGFLAGLTGRVRADDDDKGDDDQGDDDENKAINQACKAFCAGCPNKPKGVKGHCIERCKRFSRRHPTQGLCGACTATNPFPGCPKGATCCPATATKGPFCTNTSTDGANCGKCGVACAKATPGCCAGVCTDLSTTTNCGACGTKCTGTTPACCAGKCADLNSDNNNCGACGTVCATGKTCQSGACK
jgi:Stigma-specific protein, Stig1